MARAIRLVRVTASGEELAPLLEAAASRGLRLGWLEVGATPMLELEERAPRQALRAVALDSERAVTLKRSPGPPVMRDVLREHFLGCVAVLVRVVGEVPPSLGPALAGAARLERQDGGWRLERAGKARLLDAAGVVATLGRPSWWRGSEEE